MELLAPAAALALLTLPAIVALYFLKVRRPEVRVATVMFWPGHLADRQATVPWQRLRLSRLLLLQLLVAVAAVLALMRPGLAGEAGVARTTIVVLDGSPSMLATDVAPSRFGAAVDRARRLAGQLGPGRQMAVIVMGEHAQLLAAPTGDRATLDAALDRARPSGVAANLEEAISLADSLVTGRSEASVVLFSDGHSRPPSSLPRLSAPLRYESVGTARDNVAIETMGRTAEDDVFLRLANFGPAARDVRVELRADGRLVDLLAVRVLENSSAEPVWPRLPAGTKVLEARLSPGDDFAVDDAAWLVTEPPTTRRVVLVTAGNGFLSRALALRADLDVTVVEPAAYKGGDYDLSIFDGFVPAGPLPYPALVIAPPQGAGPVPAGAAIDPGGLLPANPRDPLLQYVSLRDVHVQSAAAVEPPPDWRTVIAAANGPLLLVHRGEPRVAQLTFDVHQSDLPLRAAFPVLVQNLVSYLLPGGFENQVHPLGQPVALVAASDTTRLEVTTPDDRRVNLQPPFPATLRDASVPGVYTVREVGPGSEATSRFVVQLQDPGQSRIGPGEEPLVRAVSPPAGEAPRGTLEVWPWLAGLAFVGLVAEWLVFLRG